MAGQDVDVSWTTSQEANHDYFVIERSLNGTDFDDVGQVAGVGNSNTNVDYLWVDAQVGAIVYYRLRAYDIYGQYTYSQVVQVWYQL